MQDNGYPGGPQGGAAKATISNILKKRQFGEQDDSYET